jgi:hypothetical protein
LPFDAEITVVSDFLGAAVAAPAAPTDNAAPTRAPMIPAVNALGFIKLLLKDSGVCVGLPQTISETYINSKPMNKSATIRVVR